MVLTGAALGGWVCWEQAGESIVAAGGGPSDMGRAQTHLWVYPQHDLSKLSPSRFAFPTRHVKDGLDRLYHTSLCFPRGRPRKSRSSHPAPCAPLTPAPPVRVSKILKVKSFSHLCCNMEEKADKGTRTVTCDSSKGWRS